MSDCPRCKKEIDYARGDKTSWFTGNAPSLGYVQMCVCPECFDFLEEQHATAWAKEVASHFILTTWHKPSVKQTEMIRKKVIQLLREGSAYDEHGISK